MSQANGFASSLRRMLFGQSATERHAEIAPLQPEREAPGTEEVSRTRSVETLVSGVATSDGAGVKLTRVLTEDLQRRLDPFLMLDAFRSDDPQDYIRGFPDHPHRGFETVTYMIAGRLRHRDSHGNEGLLDNGGVQWMTAGRSHGVEAAIVREVTEPLYADIALEAGGHVQQALPAGHNAFLYVYRGEVSVAGKRVAAGRMAILANEPEADGVRIDAGAGPARLLLIAGRPLGEPIVQHGPFVMNSVDEIRAAVEDFRAGRFGA